MGVIVPTVPGAHVQPAGTPDEDPVVLAGHATARHEVLQGATMGWYPRAHGVESDIPVAIGQHWPPGCNAYPDWQAKHDVKFVPVQFLHPFEHVKQELLVDKKLFALQVRQLLLWTPLQVTHVEEHNEQCPGRSGK